MAASRTTCGHVLSLFTAFTSPQLAPPGPRGRCSLCAAIHQTCHRPLRGGWRGLRGTRLISPALIIPVCSAGTGPCRSGLRRLLFHLFPHLFSLSTLPERSIPPGSRLWQRRSARMTSVVPICVTTRAWSHQAFPQAPEKLNFMRANA